ncbi:MAG: hypothetical protein HYX78_10500 [Armatimonadetes bacterium]|nr:hypothetical protein [Armatimonadota bacterium]
MRTLLYREAIRETIVDSVRRTGKLMITHQAVEQGGVGAEIAARVMQEAFDYLDAPVERVAAKNAPTPFAPVLENSVLPQVEDIVETARGMC